MKGLTAAFFAMTVSLSVTQMREEVGFRRYSAQFKRAH